MRQQFKVYLLALGFVLGVTLKALAEEPIFTSFDPPGSILATGRDINSAGEIVGRYLDADNNTHGYLRSRDGVFTSIDLPGANLTNATGINSRHEIVGAVRFPGEPSTTRHGYLLTTDGFATFDFPDATNTDPQGINARGDIVGTYTIAGVTHGFLLRGDQFTSIDFPGASQTSLHKINSRGQVLGGYVSADGHGHIFVLSEGEFRTIDLPDGLAVLPDGGINSRGDIVGTYCDTEPCLGGGRNNHGFLLSRRGDFTSIDVPGACQTQAEAINSRGDIAGSYDECGAPSGFLLSRAERDEEED